VSEFIESRADDGHCVLAVKGDVDIAVADEFFSAALACLDGTDVLELDLSELRFIDSSGLGALVRVHKRAVEQGGRLVLSHVSESVHRLLRITGLDLVFDIELEQ